MTTYSTCIFCKRNDSKPSPEEILPDWIAREFPSERWYVNDLERSRSFQSVKSFGLVSKTPCRRCNNEWMSQLESKVKPILTPLIHGEPSTINAEDQLAVARWLMKTAIVYDLHYRARTGDCFFTPDECHELMRSFAAPRDTMMFIARCNMARNEVVLRESGFEVDPDKLPDPYQNMSTYEAYTATFAIKHLALQVHSLRRPEHLIDETLFVEIPDWTPVEFQVWPLNHESIVWPPPKFLNDAGIDLFADRWIEGTLLGRSK